ncbi:PaaI family thioesterase [Dactylosporangium cerinum]|uniref:PaaI family thioesterase n=1 Tax=Dactylosporangium cerinum TaxID=1434730 RepID=A0ABV9WHK0_9ACTN
MDATALARSLLDPIPAHRTVGLEVIRAVNGLGVVAVTAPPALANVIGSLHAGGLVTLVDAAGLAAIISASPTDDAFRGVVPLGAAAALRFLAPARGRLVATCRLDPEARESLAEVFIGAATRVRVTTATDVVDDTGGVVCQGNFDWSVRRSAA